MSLKHCFFVAFLYIFIFFFLQLRASHSPFVVVTTWIIFPFLYPWKKGDLCVPSIWYLTGVRTPLDHTTAARNTLVRFRSRRRLSRCSLLWAGVSFGALCLASECGTRWLLADAVGRSHGLSRARSSCGSSCEWQPPSWAAGASAWLTRGRTPASLGKDKGPQSSSVEVLSVILNSMRYLIF